VLSGLIGYGLLVAVPIISNQVNVQFGALANVMIMLCITVWALYLIFHNKKTITESLLHLADRSLSFFSLFIRAFALVWHWLASAYFIVLCFFSLFDPGNSLKFMMGATFAAWRLSASRRLSPACCRAGSRKPSPCRRRYSATTRNCKSG
jgi:hypothetical protein